MGKNTNQEHGIKRYKTIVHEHNITKEKERMILGYLIFSIIFTFIRFFIPRSGKDGLYAYEKSQAFFLLPAVYYFIISAIVESNPDKLRYSLVITILFFMKILRRFIVDTSVILYIVYFLVLIGFFIYHSRVIKRLSVLYTSDIKKKLSLLNERYNIIFDVEALHKASLRLTVWAFAEQLFYINIDQVISLLIYNGGYTKESAIKLLLISLRFLLLYISKITESVFLRLVSIVLYLLVPIYYVLKFLTESSGRKQNFIISKLSLIISIALLIMEITLSLVISFLAYLDLDNFGKGLSRL